MRTLQQFNEPGCKACRMEGQALFPFTMAFQPIVHAQGVFAYEALVRGPNGEGAASVLGQVTSENLYAFDQACRVKAIEMAAALGAAKQRVSINFIPGAVYKAETCIRKTLETAHQVGMPLSNIIFEVTEGERVTDRKHLVSIFREYRKHGLQTAIDDFGAGYSGLDLLTDFQPDILKLDMVLIRDIDTRRASRAIVRAVVTMARDLGTTLIAEGVETGAELQTLQDLGIEYFQGYLFAKPQVAAFPAAQLPGSPAARPAPYRGPGTSHPRGLDSARAR